MPAVQVDLVTINTTVQLSVLIAAKDSTIKKHFREIRLEWDDGNGAAEVVRGGTDPNISDTRFGFRLFTTERIKTYRDNANSLSTDSIYLRPSAANMEVNVELTEL